MYVGVCGCVWVSVPACVRACVCAYLFGCVCVRACVRVCVYVYARIHTQTHTHTHTSSRTHTHTRTHIYPHTHKQSHVTQTHTPFCQRRTFCLPFTLKVFQTFAKRYLCSSYIFTKKLRLRNHLLAAFLHVG